MENLKIEPIPSAEVLATDEMKSLTGGGTSTISDINAFCSIELDCTNGNVKCSASGAGAKCEYIKSLGLFNVGVKCKNGGESTWTSVKCS